MVKPTLTTVMVETFRVMMTMSMMKMKCVDSMIRINIGITLLVFSY